MPVPELLRLFSHDRPRRLAARISEPYGVHLPELADIFVKKRRGRAFDHGPGRSGGWDLGKRLACRKITSISSALAVTD